MGKFRLQVLVDPLFGHPDWADYGVFADERSLAAAIKAVAEEFRDSECDLDKYVLVEPEPRRSRRRLRPSAILGRHFPEWSARFFQCMRQCDQCMMRFETEPAGENGSEYICRKGKPWFGTMPCPYYLSMFADAADVAARELMAMEIK